MKKIIRDIFDERRMIEEMTNKEYSEYIIEKLGFSHGTGKHKKNSKKRRRKRLDNIILK